MNKVLRFFLILAVLVGFVAVAGSQTAWANKVAAPVAGSADAAANTTNRLTTVSPGGCGALVLVDRTVTSICGIATVVSNNGEEIGTAFVGNRPDGFKNKLVTILLNRPGDAILCFVARHGGTIYSYNAETQLWTPLATTNDHGIACAQISTSGDYVLGK
jgi:hypothetical protein